MNNKAKPNVKNVFALFLDTITGNVLSYAAESRGKAGTALLAYIQRYGKPNKLIHDNAQEFMHGEFIHDNKEFNKYAVLPTTPTKTRWNNTWAYLHV